MNIIGIAGLKILALFAVWIPCYSPSAKLVLTGVCVVKLIWDYDRSRPGHKGLIYKLTSKATIEVQDIIAGITALTFSAIFAVASIKYAAWIPVGCGVLSVAISLFELVRNLKDMIN